MSRPEVSGLFEDQLLEGLLGQVVELHLKLEGLLCDGLVFRVVVLLQVGMGEGFLNLKT